ncbi:MAG: hypothetical protein K2G51_03810 [Lachnospiraceae bacterium]|nr:hypothetical protein [Lachnospiraceae bacterium]MDE7274530.1 hypothetical protein [Lachnospiraceae bacterium]
MGNYVIIKIIYYELRRMLLNKIFFGMLLVNGLFAWFILSYEIIMGTAYTAPFSVWSYCVYLGRTLSLAMITVLLLLARYYSRKQKQVEVLTSATPVSSLCQTMIRTLAAGICFLLIYLVVIALGLMFYVSFFRFHDFAAFILPSVLLLLPCFVLFTGLGQLLGSLHRSLVYILMLASFALSSIPMPSAFDFFGAGYFSTVPLTLPVGADGEPVFELSAAFLTTRLLYLVLGIICIYLTTILSARKSQKA